MSRSYRKTPIIGITTAKSEKGDKKVWHSRWRARERTLISSSTPEHLESYLPVLEIEVSNTWQTSKDGKQYWSIKSQAIIAEETAQNKGQTQKEIVSIKQRQLQITTPPNALSNPLSLAAKTGSFKATMSALRPEASCFH